MNPTRRGALRGAAAMLSSIALPGALRAQGKPLRIGSTLALTGPLAATAHIHKLVGEIYVEQLNKRGGLLGRPVEWIVKDDQSKPDLARTLYEQLDHRRQGRPADGPVRDRRDPVGDGRRAALQQGARAPHVRHPVARQVRHAVPGLVARLGPGERRCRNTSSTRWPRRPKPPKTIAIVTSKFPSIHFMSLGAREVAEEARPARGAVPRVGVRQPRLRPDRQPHQGRQARLRLGRRDRPRRQPAARRDEEDRLRAAAALLHVPGAGPDGDAARGEERAVGDDLRGAPAVHQRPGAAEFVEDSITSAPPRPACPTPSVETAGRGVVHRLADPRGRR